jgi:hypothetical protein
MPDGQARMVLFGKTLQALGMVLLLIGLFFGVTEERGMGKEYAYLLLGSATFLAGRFLERR